MREVCGGCERPGRGCVCQALPQPPLRTSGTQVLVLQHPHECRQKLSTLPLLRRCLPLDLHAVVSRRLRLGSSPLLDSALASPPSLRPPVLLLFPGPHALDLRSWWNSSPACCEYPNCFPSPETLSLPLSHLSLPLPLPSPSPSTSSFEKESAICARSKRSAVCSERREEKNPVTPKNLPVSPIRARCNGGLEALSPSPSSFEKELVIRTCFERLAGSDENGENPILPKKLPSPLIRTCCDEDLNRSQSGDTPSPSSSECESIPASCEGPGCENGENPTIPKKLPSSPIHACCNEDLNHSQSGDTLLSSLSEYELTPASREEVGCGKAESPVLKKPGCILVIIDGTWKQAKEMVKASAPFLRPFSLQVCLPFDRVAEGGCIADSELILRKEPYAGCVSTMEAVATCLGILEPHGSDLECCILSVLRSVVRFQASHIRVHKTRFPKKDLVVEKGTAQFNSEAI